MRDMLNRAALIVRPAKPFQEWAAGLDDSGLVPSADDEQTVYLIPDFDDDDEFESILRVIYAGIFEHQLYGWHTVESAWPKKRSFEIFREWFQIEYHTVIEDLVAGPLLDDEG
jgi:hypothetical protein